MMGIPIPMHFERTDGRWRCDPWGRPCQRLHFIGHLLETWSGVVGDTSTGSSSVKPVGMMQLQSVKALKSKTWPTKAPRPGSYNRPKVGSVQLKPANNKGSRVRGLGFTCLGKTRGLKWPPICLRLTSNLWSPLALRLKILVGCNLWSPTACPYKTLQTDL